MKKVFGKTDRELLGIIMISLVTMPTIIYAMIISVNRSLLLGILIMIISQYLLLTGIHFITDKYTETKEMAILLLILKEYIKDIYVIGFDKRTLSFLDNYNINILHDDCNKLVFESSLVVIRRSKINDKNKFDIDLAEKYKKTIIEV